MKLVLAASGLTPDAMPPAIGEFEAPAGDAALSTSAKLATARRILFDQTYSDNVANIMAPTEQFERALDERTNAAIESADSARAFARTILVVLAILIPLTMAGILWIFYAKVSRVIVNYRQRLEDGSSVALEPAGTVELCALADAFNTQSHDVRVQFERNAALVAELNGLVGEVSERGRNGLGLLGADGVDVAPRPAAPSGRSPPRSATSRRAPSVRSASWSPRAKLSRKPPKRPDPPRRARAAAPRPPSSPRASPREGADAAAQATTAIGRPSPRLPDAVGTGIERLVGRSPSASAGSSPRSPASPSRPTCSPSTPPSRPPAPASRAEALPSSPKKSASSPRNPRQRPARSPR